MATASKQSNTIVRLLLLVLAALVLFALVSYYQKSVASKGTAERFNQALTPGGQDAASASYSAPPMPVPSVEASSATAAAFPAVAKPQQRSGVAAMEDPSTEHYLGVEGQGGACPSDPYPQDRLRAEYLLPKDASNSKWAQMNPAGQGDVQNQNLLTAGYHLGVDTQGSSLRNASHDIRSSPPNPRYRVSIWNQSDIEPDLTRRPIE